MKVEVDQKALSDIRYALREFPHAIDRVIVQAINKSLPGTQKDAVQYVRAKVNLTAKRIRKDSKIYKASKQRQTGRVEFRGGKIGLYNFGARQSRLGVSFRIWRGGPLQRLRHAFIGTTTTKKGDQTFYHVFEREWRGEKSKRKKKKVYRYWGMPKEYRYPIRRLEGPSIPSMVERNEINSAIMASAWDRYKRTLAARLNYEVEHLKGK